jgi:hypothetical protein
MRTLETRQHVRETCVRGAHQLEYQLSRLHFLHLVERERWDEAYVLLHSQLYGYTQKFCAHFLDLAGGAGSCLESVEAMQKGNGSTSKMEYLISHPIRF